MESNICDNCNHSLDRDWASNTCPFKGTPECDIEKHNLLHPKAVWVMMPVRCLGKMCSDCEYLRIDTEVGLEKDAKGRYKSYTNLRCHNVDKCMKLKQMMEEYKDG